MAALDPVISTRTYFTNDAVPFSNHQMDMPGLGELASATFGIVTSRRKYRLLAPVVAGIDAAIGYSQPIANDAIPVSNHPMKMTGSSHVMTGSNRCVGTSTARAVGR